MKYLKYFKQLSDYQIFKESGDYILPNVSYVTNNDVVNYHPYVPPSMAGDIAYGDGYKVKTISSNNGNASLGTSVGVVVVPKGFAPDGKIRICALGHTTSKGCYNNHHDLTELPTYGGIVNSKDPYLPTEGCSVNICQHDPVAGYPSPGGTKTLLPSPYITVNNAYEPNPDYHSEYTDSGQLNALSDFGGLNNTNVLSNKSSWYGGPIAAKNYSDGYSDLEWYLPAMGELGYFAVRGKSIQESLDKLGSDTLPRGYTYLSSTSQSTDGTYSYVWTLSQTDLYCSRKRMDVEGYVLPFAIINE